MAGTERFYMFRHRLRIDNDPSITNNSEGQMDLSSTCTETCAILRFLSFYIVRTLVCICLLIASMKEDKILSGEAIVVGPLGSKTM